MSRIKKNRRQMRKIKRISIKKAAAFVLAGVMTLSGISLPTGIFAYAGDNTLLAFEGAAGGGRFATGGRGYDVYVVTTLEDYGKEDNPIEGSLRYGIEKFAKEKGGAIIVFNVGGTIALKQTLSFKETRNVTVAGQTAPGDGITLSGWDTNISNSQNLIIRYMRFRPGAANVHTGGDSMDALWGRDNKTFIIDHCSFSWNTDETLSTYRGQDGTVQWCIISESLTVSGHSKGRHGYGGIFGGDNVLFQNNLIANHTSRNPRIGGGCMGDPTKDGGSTATLQISNNVIYNWGYNTCYGGGYAYTNFINNFLKPGQGTRESVQYQVIDMGESTKPGGFYVNGNYMEGNEEISADNSKGSKMSGNTKGENITEVSDTPYTAEGFESASDYSAQECYELVLAQAGATYPYRDAVDARVVAETRTDSGRYVNTEDEVGGYPAKESCRELSFDTDMDGIPDSWEIEHGLNPNNADDSAKINPSTGYAYVEEYINGLVENVEKSDYKAPNPDITIDLADNAQFNEGEDVTVTADVKANNGGSISKVEFYNGTELVGTSDKEPYSCEYKGLSDGTYNITARAYDNDGNQTQSSVSKLHINSTAGTGEWISADIGSPKAAGSASYIDGVLTVKGSGKIGKSEGSVKGSTYADSTKDDFQYTYQKISGDAEIVVKLDYATAVDNHVFSGVMFRESLDTGAKTAALGMSLVKISNETTWSTYLVSRLKTDGNISTISETIDSPEKAEKAGIPLVSDLNFKTGAEYNGTWFKLVRRGDVFTGYASDDGITWLKAGSKTIEMAEEIYVGFALDSNTAANKLENLSTAKFSNIEIHKGFADVSYELSNISTEGTDYAVVGSDFTTVLIADKGCHLPEKIQIKSGSNILLESDYMYDSESGKIIIKADKINLSEKIVITALAERDEAIEYTLQIYGDTQDITVVSDNGVMSLEQTADSSSMVTKKGSAGKNLSYILFPKSDEAAKMTLKLKINSFKNGKSSGVYAGVFQPDGDYLYNSIAFRGTGDTNAVSPYWIKVNATTPSKDGVSGNGSPKFALSKQAEYTISIEKKSDNTYYAVFGEEGSDVKNEKIFKSSDSYLTPDLGAQFGIAINSAKATVSEMKLMDMDGNVLYDQSKNSNDETIEPDPTPTPKPDVQSGYMKEESDGKKYWYENGVKQGTEGIGKEVYDPVSEAWYWLDADNGGAVAVDKDVNIPDGTLNGKWVRFDSEGKMIKGEDYRYGGWYYFDEITGAMIKGFVNIADGTKEGKWVYYDEITGQMHHGSSVINGNNYHFDEYTGKMTHGAYTTADGTFCYYDEITGIGLDCQWKNQDGKDYWYENGVRQGLIGRGKEIYDPVSEAWYWLDSVSYGAKAVSKDVYQETYAGEFADNEDGTGKWVRYDSDGAMIKGWSSNANGTYYFDVITGAMAKGTVNIDGQMYTFDKVTGILQ